MKQNNANMLFKSLALCFLILGNLTFEVLCAPAASAAAVTVEEKDVAVPTSNVCTVINRHYKVQSKDFFSILVKPAVGVTNYTFQFNSKNDGKAILADKIRAAIDEAKKVNSVLTAEDAFKAFTTEVDTITKAATELKTPVDVSPTDLEKFMSNFEFSNNKFVLKSAGSAVTLNDIADNLVVYLNGDLAALKVEVEKIQDVTATIDTLEKALIDAQVKLVAEDAAATKAADDAKAAADAAKQKAADEAKSVAQTALDTLKNTAIEKARKQAKDAVLSKLTTPATPSTSTTLKDLLDALNKYHIKTEYNYVAADATTLPPTVASAKVTYSIATSAVSAGDSKISSVKVDIKAADIGNDKIFVPQFIDTKNALAKDVFVAISEKCTDADANACFKAILAKFSSTDFAKTVGDVLSTVVPEKKVSQTEFNNVFDSFNTLVPVDVAEDDIKTIANLVTVENDNCKVKLHYLSNDEKPFDNYIAWLENEKLKSATVADKTAAVNAFFTILKDNLAAYKTKLEKDLESKGPDDKKPDDKKHDDNETKKKPIVKQQQESNAQPTPKAGMSKTTKIIISVVSVGGFLILSGIGLVAYWKLYSTKSSGVV